MISINTDTSASIAGQALARNERTMATSMERLSTGLRINAAKDDPAGLAITKKMAANLSGMQMGMRNLNDGISMIQTIEGAAQTILSALTRMRELKVQSLNGTYRSSDLENIGQEYNQLREEILRTIGEAEWNGIEVMSQNQPLELYDGFSVHSFEDIIKNWNPLIFENSSGRESLTTSGSLLGNPLNIHTYNSNTPGTVPRVAFSKVGDLSLPNQGILNITLNNETFNMVNTSGSTLTGVALVNYMASKYSSTGRFGGDLTLSNSWRIFGGEGSNGNFYFIGKEVGPLDIAGLNFTISSYIDFVSIEPWSSVDNLNEIDSVLSSVNSQNAIYGASINSLIHSIDNLSNSVMNLRQSLSRIEDADYALETANLAKTKIIAQASTAMLAQANQNKSTILTILKTL